MNFTKQINKNSIKIIGLIGSIASIIGLIAYFIDEGNLSLLSIMQHNSSIVYGEENQVKVINSKKEKKVNTKSDKNSTISINQIGSSIIYGSHNKVIVNSKEEVKYDTSINITKQYRHLVEFSIVGNGGIYEILQLYVEVIQMCECTTSHVNTEAMNFRNIYNIFLVPDVRFYPILPPTLTSTQGTWTLKDKDIELFTIKFHWPSLTAAAIKIKAEVFDHIAKKSKYISSHFIQLQRNGESRTDICYTPQNNKLNISPYLYKILTIENFEQSSKESKLNQLAYQEIASLFNLHTNRLDELINSKEHNIDMIFKSKVNPIIALQLLEIGERLKKISD